MTANFPSPADLAAAAAFMRAMIDKPYVGGALGPDAYNCWGLAKATQLILFGRDLPVNSDEIDPAALQKAIATIADVSKPFPWREAKTPWHGDLATAWNGKDGKHIGTWFANDGGGIFHTAEGAGVGFLSPTHFRLQGWSRPKFYRYVGVSA